MSYDVGIQLLNLIPAARHGHVMYCSHEPLRKHVWQQTGLILEDAWECDLIWHTNDGPIPWSERGRVTDMGHAEFLAGGIDRREPRPCPFRCLQEAQAFDAVAEYGLPEHSELVAYYEKVFEQGCKAYPNQVFTGGYYKTLLSGAIETFGWDMLLQLAADQDAFEKVLESYFQLTLHHCRAWSQTNIEAFILHDDIVWTQGPFMQPSFYRRILFPRYTALVNLLQRANKKVLFCSDGNWTTFIEDVAATGADGFIFEPTIPLERMTKQFGKTHILIGSTLDCRTLTFGNPQEIANELDATFELAQECNGFFVAVGNHIPSNVPLENALFYWEYLKAHRWR